MVLPGFFGVTTRFGQRKKKKTVCGSIPTVCVLHLMEASSTSVFEGEGVDDPPSLRPVLVGSTPTLEKKTSKAKVDRSKMKRTYTSRSFSILVCFSSLSFCQKMVLFLV